MGPKPKAEQKAQKQPDQPSTTTTAQDAPKSEAAQTAEKTTASQTAEKGTVSTFQNVNREDPKEQYPPLTNETFMERVSTRYEVMKVTYPDLSGFVTKQFPGIEKLTPLERHLAVAKGVKKYLTEHPVLTEEWRKNSKEWQHYLREGERLVELSKRTKKTLVDKPILEKLENKSPPATAVGFLDGLSEDVNKWTWEQKYQFLELVFAAADLSRLNILTKQAEEAQKEVLTVHEALQKAYAKKRDSVRKVLQAMQNGDDATEAKAQFQSNRILVAKLKNRWEELSAMSRYALQSSRESLAQPLRRALKLKDESMTKDTIFRYLIRQRQLIEHGFAAKWNGSKQERVALAVDYLYTQLNQMLDMLDDSLKKDQQCKDRPEVRSTYETFFQQYVIDQAKKPKWDRTVPVDQAVINDMIYRLDQNPDYVPAFLNEHSLDVLRAEYPLMTHPVSFETESLCSDNYERVNACCVWKKQVLSAKTISLLPFAFASRFQIQQWSAVQHSAMTETLLKAEELTAPDVKSFLNRLQKREKEAEIYNLGVHARIVGCGERNLWAETMVKAPIPNVSQDEGCSHFFGQACGWLLYQVASTLTRMYNQQTQKEREDLAKIHLDNRKPLQDQLEAKQKEGKELTEEDILSLKKQIQEDKNKEQTELEKKELVKLAPEDFFKPSVDWLVKNQKWIPWVMWLNSQSFRATIYKRMDVYSNRICQTAAVTYKSYARSNTVEFGKFVEQQSGTFIPLVLDLSYLQGFLSADPVLQRDTWFQPVEEKAVEKQPPQIQARNDLLQQETEILRQMSAYLSQMMLKFDLQVVLFHMMLGCFINKPTLEGETPSLGTGVSLYDAFSHASRQALASGVTLSRLEQQTEATIRILLLRQNQLKTGPVGGKATGVYASIKAKVSDYYQSMLKFKDDIALQADKAIDVFEAGAAKIDDAMDRVQNAAVEGAQVVADAALWTAAVQLAWTAVMYIASNT